MARLVSSIENQLVTCDVITKFSDGTESLKRIKVEDIVRGLRYIENHELKSISGRVVDIVPRLRRRTLVNVDYPEDHFADDVKISLVIVDGSQLYHSNVVEVNAIEIVEDEGVEDVERVEVRAFPGVTLEMAYTDGTTEYQDVVVGDVLCDMEIISIPGLPPITGDFRVAAFNYAFLNNQIIFTGLYLVPLKGGTGIYATFDEIIRFTEKPRADVTDPTSLSELSSALLNYDEVVAFIDTDVDIPVRPDGRITTLMIDEGKTLTVDLNGHTINTQAYAFYVNGGTLTIRDSSGSGQITCYIKNKAYPAIQVAANGVCNMESGLIDTTHAILGDEDYNWMYGVVCSGNGIFNMTGGHIITQDAAGLSITNGTAIGEGAQFNISGTATITSTDCTAIYLADNKKVDISENAVINGGIMLRMGDLYVSGEAVVNGCSADTDVYPLGKLVCESGCENHSAGILALTGCYNSVLGNDLNIVISGSAKVNGYIDNAIDIAEVDTKYDQIVNVIVSKESNTKYVNRLWRIYEHDELADLAEQQGKRLPAKAATTDATIVVENKQVYP